MPNSDYPPAFSQNAISTVLGHIGDFSGNDPTKSSHAITAPLSLDQGEGQSLPFQGGSVPVVITGTRPPTSPFFPGLREALLGSAIFQLAEQIPDNNPLAEQIKVLAEKLHRFGAKRILDNSIPRTPKGDLKKRKRPEATA